MTHCGQVMKFTTSLWLQSLPSFQGNSFRSPFHQRSTKQRKLFHFLLHSSRPCHREDPWNQMPWMRVGRERKLRDWQATVIGRVCGGSAGDGLIGFCSLSFALGLCYVILLNCWSEKSTATESSMADNRALDWEKTHGIPALFKSIELPNSWDYLYWSVGNLFIVLSLWTWLLQNTVNSNLQSLV